jgi:hypothetical protein
VSSESDDTSDLAVIFILQEEVHSESYRAIRDARLYRRKQICELVDSRIEAEETDLGEFDGESGYVACGEDEIRGRSVDGGSRTGADNGTMRGDAEVSLKKDRDASVRFAQHSSIAL